MGRGDSITKLHCHKSDVESCEGVEFDIDKKDKRKRKGSNQRVEGPDGKKGRKQVISSDSEEGDNQDDTSGTCVVGSDLGDGGALLDIFRWEDTPKLEEYLKKHFREFRYSFCIPLQQVIHPIHDQTFYLTMDHKRKLKEECGIEDAVLIPAGCAHQVANLKGSSGLDVVGMNCHVTNLPKSTGMEIKESVQSDSRHLRQEYHKISLLSRVIS
ncbi:unnamed protein product [Lactuca saligna]|uniref:JmjC domain-containing protein n=1 Tax=Lactuca saligna TaxID=75948 RepID=A0AA36ELN5_LACSI|nr:unnamed protein product [Lactuca saligna]